MSTKKLEALATVIEGYQLNDRVFYLYASDGISRSKLVSKIELCSSVAATGRNFNTINKLKTVLEKCQ